MRTTNAQSPPTNLHADLTMPNRYTEMSDHELMALVAQGERNFRPDAWQDLWAEFRSRGLTVGSDNLYTPEPTRPYKGLARSALGVIGNAGKELHQRLNQEDLSSDDRSSHAATPAELGAVPGRPELRMLARAFVIIVAGVSLLPILLSASVNPLGVVFRISLALFLSSKLQEGRRWAWLATVAYLAVMTVGSVYEVPWGDASRWGAAVILLVIAAVSLGVAAALVASPAVRATMSKRRQS